MALEPLWQDCRIYSGAETEWFRACYGGPRRMGYDGCAVDDGAVVVIDKMF